MSTRVRCPSEVLDLLPWYPEGALGDAERGRVEAHAAECAACRHELGLIEGSAEPTPDALPDRERLWARTLSRISQSDAPRVPLSPSRPRGWQVPLAAAAVVMIALGAGLWAGARFAGGGGAVYEPAAESSAGGGARELDVVFRPEASADEIGAALRELDATIVAGPSPVTGFYRVRVSGPQAVARAAQRLRSGVASFAEPRPH